MVYLCNYRGGLQRIPCWLDLIMHYLNARKSLYDVNITVTEMIFRGSILLCAYGQSGLKFN